MMRIFYLLLFCSYISSCVKEELFDSQKYECNTSIINTHPKGAEYQAFLEQKVKEGLPGVSMLIETTDGIWTGSAGVADIPSKVLMKSCSMHKLGSTTKIFTATLIFQLYEEGLLSFDDPITKFLPLSLLEKVANHEKVTVENLLNHSSGLAEMLDIRYAINYYNDLTRVWTDKEELSMIYGEPAVFDTGTKVSYSNTNYLLLGMIAKSIRAQSGGDLYKNYIFDPLGMDNSYFNEDGSNPYNLVRGYFDENGKGNMIDITDRAYVSHSMAGGASSTVEDMHLFLKTFWETESIVTDKTKSLITKLEGIPFLKPEDFVNGEEHKVNRVEGIGLCWFQADTDYGISYGHRGGFDGRRSVLRYFPDSRASIAYFVNGSGESLRSSLLEFRRNEMIELLFE